MDRTSKFLLRKIIIDFFCIFVVGISLLMFYLFGKPFKRGFFCNDESLYHPYEESTVTSTMLYIVGIFLPICTMLIGEFLNSKKPGQAAILLMGYTIPPWVVMAYEKIGIFGFGAATTVLTTDIAKYTIGRLRPHFMALCKPDINCSLPENQHRYITDFTCTSTMASAKLLKEVRLSFPSGHSSFSMYTMLYLAMYLQLRFTWKGSKLIKHFLQFVCLLLAWYTAMTRVQNYKHHWSDVLSGLLIGVVNALVVAHCIADLFKERRTREAEEKTRDVDYEAEVGTQTESRPLRSHTPTYGGTSETSGRLF